ncbi:MAG TPA: ATP-binding protein [Thermoguttaceae bacterium]
MSEKPSVKLLLAPPSQPVQTIWENKIQELELSYRISVAESIDELVRRLDRDNFDVLLLNCSDGNVDSLENIESIQSLPAIILVGGNSLEIVRKVLSRSVCPCLLDITDAESLDLLPVFVERLTKSFADNRSSSSQQQEDINEANISHLSQGFLQNLGLALPARIALLDEQGKIMMVNQPWIDYCNDNNLLAGNFGIDRNYLELCRSHKDLGLETGPDAIEGIKSVLSGSQDTFLMEYPGSSADQQSWYHMRVVRLHSNNMNWILIVHLNTTEVRQYALSLQQIHDNLESRVEQRTAVLKATNWELHQEIAHRAAAEQAVSEERNRFRTLVDTISHGIVEFDLQGRITFANAAYHRIYEYPVGSLIGKIVWDILKPDPSDARRFYERALREQTVPTSYYTRRLTLGGRYVDLKVDWNYKHDSQGKIAGFVVVITNVTQQRRAEEEAQERLNQLAHVARIFTMNQMVSGLAHELNQPLTAIANFANACCYKIRNSPADDRNMLLESIDQISLQAERASQIVRRLRDFVRRADSCHSIENINDLVNDVLGMLEIEARTRSIGLEVSLAADLPRIPVDRIQIEQVITNLVKNAMEAMQDLSPEGRQVILRTGMNAEGMLEVSVSDAGKGVEAAELSRIFEPFYTTKQSGMGLGLGISRSIVEAHGGRLEALRNDHRGMTFRFTLPIAVEGQRA